MVRERARAVPKVVLCEFSSYTSMMAAVRTQKNIASMDGLWLALDRFLIDRMKYRRLFKVKRNIIELTNCLIDEIVIARPLRKIFATSGPNLVEICHVLIASEMNWFDSFQNHVRSHIGEVLGE